MIIQNAIVVIDDIHHEAFIKFRSKEIHSNVLFNDNFNTNAYVLRQSWKMHKITKKYRP
jgi:hypothetical protein